MKKMPKNPVLAIAIALLGAVWVFAAFAYTMNFGVTWLCWGEIACTAIAVIAAELYLLVFQKHPSHQAVESGALGSILTIGYLLIVVLLNSIFILLGCAGFHWLLLTLNVAGLAGYVILLLWVERHTARLAAQLTETEDRTAPTKNIARKLGELLAIMEDAETRNKLLKLKEAVDYGTNISTRATAERERQLNELLDELLQLTISKADRRIILNKVEAAEMTWKLRSNSVSSAR